MLFSSIFPPNILAHFLINKHVFCNSIPSGFIYLFNFWKVISNATDDLSLTSGMEYKINNEFWQVGRKIKRNKPLHNKLIFYYFVLFNTLWFFPSSLELNILFNIWHSLRLRIFTLSTKDYCDRNGMNKPQALQKRILIRSRLVDEVEEQFIYSVLEKKCKHFMWEWEREGLS